MRQVTDRCRTAIAAFRLQLVRIRGAIDASRAQIVSATGLIEDSEERLTAHYSEPLRDVRRQIRAAEGSIEELSDLVAASPDPHIPDDPSATGAHV